MADASAFDTGLVDQVCCGSEVVGLDTARRDWMDICALGLVGRGCETIGDAEGPEGGMERDWETCQEERLAGEYMIKEKKRTNRDMGAGRDGAGKDKVVGMDDGSHVLLRDECVWDDGEQV